MPGDRVRVEPSGLAVNGREVPGTRLLGRDTQGRPLPHARLGEHRLAENAIWVLGCASPRSWDSRYFGPIGSTQIVATVQPWLTWE